MSRGKNDLAWTQEEEGTALAMRRQGCTFEAIGKAIGRSPKAVSARLLMLRRIIPCRRCPACDMQCGPQDSCNQIREWYYYRALTLSGRMTDAQAYAWCRDHNF